MAVEIISLKESVAQEFLEAFRLFDRNLFDGKLSEPTVRIDLDKKWSFRFQAPFELVIGRGLAKATLEDSLRDLLHEMVHIANWQQDRSDHTSNGYHNQYFADAALDIGFYVLKHRNQGWGVTDLYSRTTLEDNQCPEPARNARLKKLVNEARRHINVEIFKEAQDWIKREVGQRVPKVYQLKFVCGCPSPFNSIRSGRRPSGDNALSVTCNKCGQAFKPVDDDD